MSERKFPFYREGENLAGEPAGWVVYGEKGQILRHEWNPKRQESPLERVLSEQHS